YIYAVILIIQGCIAERGGGSWKYTLAKGVALFGANRDSQHPAGDVFPRSNDHRQFFLMRPLRDTRSKLTSRVKFLGVEGGVLPVIVSGAVSSMLIAIAAQSGSIPMACLGAMPFVLTFGYLLIFVTGRRPHFTRDVVCRFLYGRALSPRPPGLQPVNPARRVRATA